MSITHHIMLLMTFLFISASTFAASLPLPLLSPSAKPFTDEHNKARAMVGVPPLVWNQTLEAAASRLVRYQRNHKKCEFVNPNSIKYGGNQLRSGLTMKPSRAVEAFVEEKAFYDYKSNTCAPNHTCGSYMQVVWRNSKELGCAQATCKKESKILTICFYNPPGSYIGERPY